MRTVSLMIAASVWGTVAQAKDLTPAELVGCWQIKSAATRSRQDLCFGANGIAKAGWANMEEGMDSSGRYRIKGDRLTILETDGNGGPPRPEIVIHCRVALNVDGSELILRNCTFKGEWKRLCTKLKTDKIACA